MARTVRINAETHRVLRELSVSQRVPMTDLLAEAVERLRRRYRLLEINASVAALREDPDAWTEELAGRELWDQTLADDLDDE